MSELSLRKCDKCGAPVKLYEPCEVCAGIVPKNAPGTGYGHAVGSSGPTGYFPKHFPGRKNTRTHIGTKLQLRQRVDRAQRVGLIMIALAIGIILVKHHGSDVRLNLTGLFGQITNIFSLRDSGTPRGVLSYLTIALSIDAMVLLILYFYSCVRPVPGLMLIVVASVVDSILLFDPVILVNPKAIIAILLIKIVVIILLLSGYKSANLLADL